MGTYLMALSLFAFNFALVLSVPPSNVILFVFDDLSPFYLDPGHQVKMPSVKNLASRGIEFVNAHTAFPVCGPSRFSILSGRYADITKLFTFERHIEQVPELTTFPKYLTQHHNFDTIGFGKVLHVDGNGPRDPFSRSFAQQGHWTKPFQYGGSNDECRKNEWFCNITTTEAAGDFNLGQKVISFLSQRRLNEVKPFLAVVGLRRPHMELAVPALFVHPLVGTDHMQLSEPNSVDVDGLEVPFNRSLSRYECFHEVQTRTIDGKTVVPLNLLDANIIRRIRQYYFAASTWADSVVGDIVAFVDNSPRWSDNTAFVVISDHGFSNGEHGMFCKSALFDQQTRVPFVVTPARSTPSIRGVQRFDPVDLMHVFPTLVHLATGVDLGRNAVVDMSGLTLSRVSVLTTPESVYAFSQYPRCALLSGNSDWQCVTSGGANSCNRKANIFMGYAIRTKHEKYVEWRPFRDIFTKCKRPNWEGLPLRLRNRMKRVQQIDPVQTGTVWQDPPNQRELFIDYTDPLNWSSWEKENILLADHNQDNDEKRRHMIMALELSTAIRWRFDPHFSNAEEPCSGHGMVCLLHPLDFVNFRTQPQRNQVYCQCLQGWKGLECETQT